MEDGEPADGAPGRPVLAVKLVVPPPRRGEVPRERLLRRLDDSDAPLCVVVAPAGWGKTRLLAQWAERAGRARPVAWLSLDAGDDDPQRFWVYLTRSVATATGVGDDALRALSAASVDPLVVAVPLLLNALVADRSRVVVVLDDYHVIRDRRIHEGLEFLLAYLPATVQLVVAGRADPALPLARLRGRAELTELRADDLRLSAEEASAMLAAAGHGELRPDTVAHLWRRTEGWAAGLRLVALTLGAAPVPEVAASRISGDDRHVLDYLSEEVLDGLAPADRDFLVRTSVLEQLSGPLCDAVLERTGSAEVLDDLERRNLFLQPLDHRRRWYRCHGLFRDVLRQELERQAPGLPAELLRRAAGWHAEQGAVEQAVRHRLAAGDDDGAVALLHDHESWFFDRGWASTYLALGEQAVARSAPDPQVMLMLAYAAALCGRFDRVVAWCDAAEPLVRDATSAVDGWRSARASVLTMRAAYGRTGDAEAETALAEARRAVDLEDDPTLPGFVVARVALASALLRTEQPRAAVAVLAEAWAQPARRLLPTPVLLQATGLHGLALLSVGEVEHAAAVIADVVERAAGWEETWGDAAAASLTWLRLAEGRIAHRRGDPGGAVAALRRAATLAETWGRATELLLALTGLAEAELAAGDRPAARESLTRAREVTDTETCRRSAVAELERVEARIGRGAVRAARRLGRLHEELTDRELSILRALAGPAPQREIAGALFLSVNTVKGYTKSLYRKLGAASRAEAVQQGRRLGLI